MGKHTKQINLPGDIRYILGWTKVKVIATTESVKYKTYCLVLKPATTSKFSEGEYRWFYDNTLYKKHRWDHNA